MPKSQLAMLSQARPKPNAYHGISSNSWNSQSNVSGQISEECLQGDEKEAGEMDLLWMMDLFIIVTVTMLHRCVSMQTLIQLNSPLCEVHCRPGQLSQKT